MKCVAHKNVIEFYRLSDQVLRTEYALLDPTCESPDLVGFRKLKIKGLMGSITKGSHHRRYTGAPAADVSISLHVYSLSLTLANCQSSISIYDHICCYRTISMYLFGEVNSTVGIARPYARYFNKQFRMELIAFGHLMVS